MSLSGLVLGFVVLAIAFGLIEYWPAAPPRRWTDPSVRTDLVFWFFTPLVTRTFTTIAVGAALVTAAAAVGVHVNFVRLSTVLSAHGPVGRQRHWLQVVEALIVSDGLGYGMHRLFHLRRLWPFHAVHHGSEHVDWLSSVRLHPVNEALMRMAQVLPLVGLGFDPRVLAATVPVFTFYALLLHANVNWTFGVFRYVIATPAFHRWHHAAEAEALDKNFAGLFPFWDLLFGTFYVPSHPPAKFGLPDSKLPEGLWAQLLSPFRTDQASSLATSWRKNDDVSC